jgi:hypothetical protein
VDAPLVISDSDSEDGAPGHKGVAAGIGMALNRLPKEKRPHRKKQLKAHQGLSDESGEEKREGSAATSDGESALRSIQVHEQRKQRGPENHTLNHWNEPKATIDRKSKLRWMFKCQYCDQ